MSRLLKIFDILFAPVRRFHVFFQNDAIKCSFSFSSRHIKRISWPTQLALIAAVASLAMGYNLSILNTPFPIITAHFGWCGTIQSSLDDPMILDIPSKCYSALKRQSLLTATFMLSCALGSLFSGTLMLTLGRRMTLIITYSIMCISFLIGSLSFCYAQLVVSRVFAGVASGVATVIPGVYMTEMAPPALHASFSTLPQLAVNTGIFLGICTGLPLRVSPVTGLGNAEQNFSLTQSDWNFNRLWWRLMLAAAFPLCLVVTILLVVRYTFDTPAYLRLRGQQQAALDVESLIFGKLTKANSLGSASSSSSPPGGTTTRTATEEQEGQHEQLHIFQTCKHEATAVDELELADLTAHSPATTPPRSSMSLSRSLLDALSSSPALRYKLLIGWTLAAAQQMTGINVFMATSNSIFASAGIPSDQLSQASVAMAALGLICALAAPSFLGKVRRRSMLIGGALGMAVSLAPVCFSVLLLPPDSSVHQVTAVLSTLTFIVAYGLSYGPGLFLYLNELFPLEVKDPGLALAFTVNWLTGFAVVSTASLVSQRHCYIIFALSCIGFGAFAYYCAPETGPSHKRGHARVRTSVPEADQNQSVVTPSELLT